MLNDKNAEADYHIDCFDLSVNLTQELKKFSRKHGLTLSTLFQTAWALLLARYNQASDVMFGVTLSTRPAELKSVDNTLGLMINTVPLRVTFTEKTKLIDCLCQVRQRFSVLLDHASTPLTAINEWSELTPESNLFDSIVVFENYPVDNDDELIFHFGNLTIYDPIHYPIAFIIFPKDPILFEI